MGAAGIDDERGGDADGCTAALTGQHGVAGSPLDSTQPDLVDVVRTERNRFLHQKLIDVGPQPVRVGRLVARDSRPPAVRSRDRSAGRIDSDR